MPWFKVDDGFSTSRKVIQIPRRDRFQAIGLWTMAGNFAAKELTDGHIPAFVLDELGAPDELVEVLISVGLWDRLEDGEIWFHDWCEYQPSASEYKAKREARSKAGTKGGQKSVEAKAKQKLSKTQANGQANFNPEPEPEPEPEPFTSSEVNKTSDLEFDEFWEIVPRKVQKALAKKAFAKAAKAHGAEIILDGIRRLASDPNLPEPRFIPHPATWLNAEGWLDDPYPARTTASAKQQQQSVAADRFLQSFNQPAEITANPDWA